MYVFDFTCFVVCFWHGSSFVAYVFSSIGACNSVIDLSKLAICSTLFCKRRLTFVCFINLNIEYVSDVWCTKIHLFAHIFVFGNKCGKSTRKSVWIDEQRSGFGPEKKTWIKLYCWHNLSDDCLHRRVISRKPNTVAVQPKGSTVLDITVYCLFQRQA